MVKRNCRCDNLTLGASVNGVGVDRTTTLKVSKTIGTVKYTKSIIITQAGS